MVWDLFRSSPRLERDVGTNAMDGLVASSSGMVKGLLDQPWNRKSCLYVNGLRLSLPWHSLRTTTTNNLWFASVPSSLQAYLLMTMCYSL